MTFLSYLCNFIHNQESMAGLKEVVSDQWSSEFQNKDLLLS